MNTRREFLVKAASIGGAIAASGAGLYGATKGAESGVPGKSRNFVFVHGAFHGGWCYQRVADILRGQGHRVYTPTLTGLGERSHLAGFQINFSTHLSDVINVIHWERLDDVILCGHSYGGIVIAAIADAIPEKVAATVYLDCPLPENGKSIFDLEPQILAPFVRATGALGGFMIKPMPNAAEAFGVNAADRDMVNALLTPHPLATLCERLNLTGAYKRIARKVYVKATGWNKELPVPATIAQDPEWKIFVLRSGHDLMIDVPGPLTDVLLSVS